ncbi:hypothetical protein [Thalassolituus sp. UBA3500]|uniref:hypothetical protein n=1 Tax=Thalassolituus sp. UBA3500 TaxID=1947664 RepID=UPI000C0DE76D|nr:hypothetical protein [Thalassolituus sp. UBA3500]MBN58548.1 hypothetical protein [Oceanospirillaceae bacterium]|tara:strand:+ start:26468 stop:26662 length:195 start_codon:yes stop_codon:yes gene_type:complete
MNVIKTMGLIGIILFTICFFCMSAFIESDVEAAIGFSSIAIMYGIGFSITAFLKAKKAISEQQA